MVTHFHGLVTD